MKNHTKPCKYCTESFFMEDFYRYPSGIVSNECKYCHIERNSFECKDCHTFKHNTEMFRYSGGRRSQRCIDCEDDRQHRLGIRTNSGKPPTKSAYYAMKYLDTHPCVDCGESDPIVLEFDHLPEHEKHYNISDLKQLFGDTKLIEYEIAKCEVVCANCHKRRTAKRAGWIKGMVQSESL